MALNAETLSVEIGKKLSAELGTALRLMLGLQDDAAVITDGRPLDAIARAIANAVVEHLKTHAEIEIPSVDVKRSGGTIAQTTATTGHFLK